MRKRAKAERGDVKVSALVELASVLFLGFVLFIFLKNSTSVGSDVAAKETCKRSVQQYAELKLPGVDLASTDEIKCPVQKIVIDSGNEEKAKKEITKAMFNCFDQFGAGELELFDTRRASPLEGSRTDNYCVVCSKLTFTDKEKKIPGLASHISTETAPDGKTTYYEFFKGSEASGEEIETLAKIAPFDVVDASKDHAILFTYSKTAGWWDKISGGAIAGTTGLVIGGAAGFLTGGIGWGVTAAVLAGSSAVGVAVVKAPYLDRDWQAGIMLLPYNEDVRSYLNCHEIPVKQ